MRYSTEYGFYELNPFPGCNQMVVSNHAFIKPAHRMAGHGAAQHVERNENIFHKLYYDYAICTVVQSNVAEIKILRRNGWRILDSFHNSETGNMVSIYGKPRVDEEYDES